MTFTQLGRMPTDAEAEADPHRMDEWQSLLEHLTTDGVTAVEAKILVSAFPSDQTDCFGLAWTLVHILEASEGWPPRAVLDNVSGPWAEILRDRWK